MLKILKKIDIIKNISNSAINNKISDANDSNGSILFKLELKIIDWTLFHKVEKLLFV